MSITDTISCRAYQQVNAAPPYLSLLGVSRQLSSPIQHQMIVVLKREDGKTLHVHKTTQAQSHQKPIFQALKLTCEQFGLSHKTVIKPLK